MTLEQGLELERQARRGQLGADLGDVWVRHECAPAKRTSRRHHPANRTPLPRRSPKMHADPGGSVGAERIRVENPGAVRRAGRELGKPGLAAERETQVKDPAQIVAGVELEG